MSSDETGRFDPNRFLEEALRKIEPKDEAQRLKLDRFRERIRETNEDLARELAKVREETERSADRSGQKETIRQAEARARLARETSEGMVAAWDEHAGLLRRIVAATRRNQA